MIAAGEHEEGISGFQLSVYGLGRVRLRIGLVQMASRDPFGGAVRLGRFGPRNEETHTHITAEPVFLWRGLLKVVVEDAIVTVKILHVHARPDLENGRHGDDWLLDTVKSLRTNPAVGLDGEELIHDSQIKRIRQDSFGQSGCILRYATEALCGIIGAAVVGRIEERTNRGIGLLKLLGAKETLDAGTAMALDGLDNLIGLGDVVGK